MDCLNNVETSSLLCMIYANEDVWTERLVFISHLGIDVNVILLDVKVIITQSNKTSPVS